MATLSDWDEDGVAKISTRCVSKDTIGLIERERGGREGREGERGREREGGR